MGQQEFAQMLEGMVNNGEIAERVAGGDFADMAEGDLTEAERALLTAAAGELEDEVAGFGNFFLKLGDIDGETKIIMNTDHRPMQFGGIGMNSALGYVKLGDIKG